MSKHRLAFLEIAVLIITAMMLIVGYVLYYTSLTSFSEYVVEDGWVEWLTVLGLLGSSIVCFNRFVKLMGKRTWWFLLVTLFFGLVLLFGAGEEVSWGQRIFGLKSSDFFKQNNAQQETNFHNLVVGGVKLNKLIFSALLSIALGVYLVLIPILHRRSLFVKNLINRNAIPVARTYQVISFVVIFIITSLLPHEKRAELLECATGLLFFLIMRYPLNDLIYRKDSPLT